MESPVRGRDRSTRSTEQKPQFIPHADINGPAYDAGRIAAIVGERVGRTLAVVAIAQAGWLEALGQAGFPPPIAEIYAEMYGAFMSGRVRPVGARSVQATTRLEQVVAGLN